MPPGNRTRPSDIPADDAARDRPARLAAHLVLPCAAGLALSVLAPASNARGSALFPVAAAALALWGLAGRRPAALAAAALLVGWTLGHGGPVAGPPALLPDEAVVSGRVLEVRHDDRGGRALLAVDTVDAADTRFVARLRLGRGVPALRPGDRIRGSARLWTPRPPGNPGEPDARRRLGRQGISATGLLRDGVRLASGPPGPVRALSRARDRVRAACRRAGGDDERAGVLRALALGEGPAVPPRLRTRFAESGLAHLLAVSGLHLGLVAAGLFAGLRLLLLCVPLLRRRAELVAGAVAAPVVGLLVTWVGHPPSAARAGVMALVLLCAAATGRRRHGGAALAVAAAALAAADPALVTRPGFQLSFLAVLGLIGALPSSPQPSRWRRRLLAPLLATLAASVATAPACAVHFGRVALLGSAGNLLAVPLTGALVPAVAIAALGSALAGPPADLLWVPADRLAGVLVAIAERSSALPFASAAVEPPGPAGLLLSGLGLLLFVHRPVEPLPPRTVLLRKALAAPALVAAGLWAVPLLSRAPPPPAPLTVTFLDVGHGDAVLVRTPAGNLLVDAGGDPSGRFDVGARKVVPALQALGVRRLAAVIVTHPHPDHYGGVPAVLDRLAVDALFHTGEGADGRGGYARVLEAARRNGVPVRLACRRPLPDLGPVRLTCLGPSDPFEDGTWDPLAHANDNSIVLAVQLGRVRFLLPGDVEVPRESVLVGARAADLAADVVKAPHHGSRTSSSEAFVRAAGARHVVFSVGDRSSFRFPAPPVVRRWETAGARAWRTDRDGAVTFLTDGRRLRVRTYRRPARPP